MRLGGATLQFRMKLAAREMRMVAELDHFDEALIRRGAGEHKSSGDQLITILVVEFVTMAVTF